MNEIIIPLQRMTQLSVELKNFSADADLYFFKLKETDVLLGWNVTFDTIESIYKQAKKLKDKARKEWKKHKKEILGD